MSFFPTPCDQCRAGWNPRPDGWADKCKFCNGTGQLTITRVCELLELDPATVKRLLRGKSRKKTCQHVLDMVCALTAPPKQPELFR